MLYCVYTLSLHDALPICLSVSQLDAWLRGNLGDNPHSSQLSMMNSLSTHDSSRFLFRAGGDTGKLSLGIILQMTFVRSEEHTSELQSRFDLVCRLLLEKK